MPNVGTITGTMALDPSAYISGLNQAAGATNSFRQGVSSVSFAGFNRGVLASTTLLYGMSRIMSSMSKGMEEYANMLGRIGTVADLTAASVSALAESMKAVSVYQGVSRKDIMGGMYTAAQAGYDSPAEMRAMAASGARLSRASGKEIDVKKGVDLQSGIRQALGIGMNSVSSNRMNDILLRGRDIGRWELDQMAHALGIPLTVWGNQFAGKQTGEETLRQLLSVMSVASLSGVSPNMTATGTRRIVEKTLQLNKSGRVGDPLRNALKGEGFGGPNGIMDALNQGGVQYLNTLMKITGGGQTSELTRLGYGSRDLLVLTSALRGKGQKLNEAYEDLGYGNVAGTTERYGEKMRETYDYSRDRLRAQWEITSQQFMQASVPLISSFTSMLEGFNRVAQSLPESVKSFMMLMAALTAARFSLNLLGFRGGGFGGVPTGSMMGGAAKGGIGAQSSMSGLVYQNGGQVLRRGHEVEDTQAARLARRQGLAGKRTGGTMGLAGFGPTSGAWASKVGAPWSTAYSPFMPMSMTDVSAFPGRSGAVPMGPAWYNKPRQEPMNFVQEWAMFSRSQRFDREREASNAKHWYPDGSQKMTPGGWQRAPTIARQAELLNAAALGQHFLPGQITGKQFTDNGYGPSAQARIRWAAYKRGQSVDFGTGTYGGLSSTTQAYFANRGQGPYSRSVGAQATLNSMFGPRAIDPLTGKMGGSAMPLGLTSPGTAALLRQIPQLGSYYGSGGGGTAALSQAAGAVGSKLYSLGSAVMGVVGPFVAFSAVIAAAMSFIKGFAYSGREGQKEGGLVKLTGGASGPGFLDTIGHGFELAGTYARNGSKYVGDMQDDYARRHGFVPIGSGRPEDDKGAPSLLARLAGSTALGLLFRSIFPGNNPIGLGGNRPGVMNDVMGMVRREQMSPGMVARFSKKGSYGGLGLSGLDNFETAKPLVEKYMREQLGQEPPTDWNEWARKNLDAAAETVSEALKFAGRTLSAAAVKAAYEIEHIRMGKSTDKYTRDVPGYLGFTSGAQTLMNLEGMQREPFQPEMDAAWKKKYAAAYGVYSKRHGQPEYRDASVKGNLAGLEAEVGRDLKKSVEGPFKDVLEWNQKLRGMDFLAQNGPNLSNRNLMPDSSLIGGLNLDARNMSPGKLASVLEMIRGMDYTSWTKTHERPQAPFSQALEYGTKEGYNATLQRPGPETAVEMMAKNLEAAFAAIESRVDKNEEKQLSFNEALAKAVGDAVSAAIEKQTQAEINREDAFAGKINGPIVDELMILGGGDSEWQRNE